MTEPRTWDIGDPEPTDCTRVESDFMIWSGDQGFSYTLKLWKSRSGRWEPNTDHIALQWDWPDVVRRFGPVREVTA
ncbi:hypothetical protein [Hoyosella altamirensis]|uniref:hypothetical protein n=1 Tax=Hoyosella altamirensis TaxID=616997 RepID=UPI0007DB4081|nr:hypothetical protein [Hoyosella altamirensis]